jgi:hypothetical protein
MSGMYSNPALSGSAVQDVIRNPDIATMDNPATALKILFIALINYRSVFDCSNPI